MVEYERPDPADTADGGAGGVVPEPVNYDGSTGPMPPDEITFWERLERAWEIIREVLTPEQKYSEPEPVERPDPADRA